MARSETQQENLSTTKPLTQAHRHMLEVESGISPEVIEQRGYYTAQYKDQLEALGFKRHEPPALVIPYYPPGAVRPRVCRLLLRIVRLL